MRMRRRLIGNKQRDGGINKYNGEMEIRIGYPEPSEVWINITTQYIPTPLYESPPRIHQGP